MLVELGITQVIIQFASHEWAGLSRNPDGSVSGRQRQLSRLGSLLRLVVRWYALGGVLLSAALYVGGWLLFSAAPESALVSWRAPWLFVSLITGLTFLVWGGLAFLEGCNEVLFVYRFRAAYGIIGSFLVWAAILLGGGLWAVAIPSTVGLVAGVSWIAKDHGTFLCRLLSLRSETSVSWRAEVWPLQWRVAVSLVSSYVMTGLLTPILFHYSGAVIAGRFGLTLTLVTSVAFIGYHALVQPRVPQMGTLVATWKWDDLDALVWRRWLIATAAGLCGGGILVAAVALLRAQGLAFGSRLLAPGLMAMLLAASLCRMTTQTEIVYLRAHKREPLVVVTAATAAIVCIAAWQLAAKYSVLGVAFVYLTVAALIELPIATKVFLKRRSAWHDSHPVTRSSAELGDLAVPATAVADHLTEFRLAAEKGR